MPIFEMIFKTELLHGGLHSLQFLDYDTMVVVDVIGVDQFKNFTYNN